MAASPDHRARLRLRRARHGGASTRLRENGERDVRLVGTDMSERSVGRHLCDAFHLVPGGRRPGLRRRGARGRRARGGRRRAAAVVVRPGGARRAPRALPVPVLVSGPDAIMRSNDKAETLRVPPPARRACARVPACQRRRGRSTAAARELGYPDVPVCFKPVFSSGLARVPRARPDGRPRAPAPQRAPRLGRDAPRGGGRAAARRGRARPARDGARDRRRAHDRRDRRRRARGRSGTRRRGRRCAPASRCTSSRSTTRS